MRDREGHAQQCVCAESFLIRRAVKLNQLAIDLRLVARIPAFQSRRDLVVDIGNRLLDPFAAITISFTIAQFPRFVLPGACPARDRRAAERAAF